QVRAGRRDPARGRLLLLACVDDAALARRAPGGGADFRRAKRLPPGLPTRSSRGLPAARGSRAASAGRSPGAAARARVRSRGREGPPPEPLPLHGKDGAPVLLRGL